MAQRHRHAADLIRRVPEHRRDDVEVRREHAVGRERVHRNPDRVAGQRQTDVEAGRSLALQHAELEQRHADQHQRPDIDAAGKIDRHEVELAHDGRALRHHAAVPLAVVVHFLLQLLLRWQRRVVRLVPFLLRVLLLFRQRPSLRFDGTRLHRRVPRGALAEAPADDGQRQQHQRDARGDEQLARRRRCASGRSAARRGRRRRECRPPRSAIRAGHRTGSATACAAMRRSAARTLFSRASARSMNSTMPAPNIIENSARILPSNSTHWTASTPMLSGSLPPHRFGFA